MRLNVAIALLCLLCRGAWAQGWVCAEGGGTGSGPWAAEMYGWMVEKGGKGHVVLLGAVELDEKPDPREAAFIRAGAASASSLIITAANADAQETFDAINAASIIFIRGGSQSRYVEWWKGTKTEAAIRAVFARGGVVGGTSAGCAILGEVSYDARNGSLRPEEVVKDARHPDLTLTKGFLGLVPGVLFDTHFGERARLPRLAVMLAHCREDLKVEPIGIGLDARTALCVGPDGMAEVRGEGYATVLEFTLGTRTWIEAGNPPMVSPVQVTVIPKRVKFDLNTRTYLTERFEWMPPIPVSSPKHPVRIAGDSAPDGEHSGVTVNGPWVAVGDDTHVLTNSFTEPREKMAAALRRYCATPGSRSSTVVLLTAGNAAVVGEHKVAIDSRDDQPPAAAVIFDPSRLSGEFTQTGLGSNYRPVLPESVGNDPESIERAKDALRELWRGRGLTEAQLEAKWELLRAEVRDLNLAFIPSLYRSRLHILPPGWELDLTSGIAARTPLGKPAQEP